MKILINWILSSLAVLAAAYLLAGVQVEGFLVAAVVALVLGLLNAFLKPFLLVLTLPINIFTLGLFTLVINAFIILLASWIVAGFSVASFWWALLFSLLLSIINLLFIDRSNE